MKSATCWYCERRTTKYSYKNYEGASELWKGSAYIVCNKCRGKR